MGLLNIETRASEQAGAAATNFSVVRVRRDILRRSAIGLIGTSRAPRIAGSDSNQVYGVDAALAFFENVTVNSYYARSRTPGRRGDESSYMGQFAYAADRYGMNVEHLSVGDAFNPEIGFLRRESFRRNYAQGRFSPRPRSSRQVRKVSVEGYIDYITDLESRLESREAQASNRVEFNGGGFVERADTHGSSPGGSGSVAAAGTGEREEQGPGHQETEHGDGDGHLGLRAADQDGGEA